MGYGVLGRDLDAQKVTVFDSGDNPFDATTTVQVGRAVVSSLLHYTETNNQRVYVSSFRVTQNQVLDTFKRLSGKEFEVTRANSRELAAMGKEHLEKGDWQQGYIEAVTAAIYLDSGFSNFGERSAYWNRVLDLPAASFETAARDVMARRVGFRIQVLVICIVATGAKEQCAEVSRT